MNERPWYRLLAWMTAFAIAMAFLESAVVVYLRALYYPGGFRFPLVPIHHDLGTTEVLREVATLLMLLAPGALLTRSALQRFGWFCFCFGVWDIFYYVFLKALLGWPDSFFTWDILFLVPVPWVGPVLAPCIVSIGLISLACILLASTQRDPGFRVRWVEWGLLILGVVVILFSFMSDYLHYLHELDDTLAAWSIGPGDEATFAHATTYVPRHFDWWTFLAGCGLSACATSMIARRAVR